MREEDDMHLQGEFEAFHSSKWRFHKKGGMNERDVAMQQQGTEIRPCIET
jgi:hypothetical protein